MLTMLTPEVSEGLSVYSIEAFGVSRRSKAYLKVRSLQVIPCASHEKRKNETEQFASEKQWTS